MRDSLQIFSFLFSEWAVGESGDDITDKEHLARNCQNRQSNPGLITVPKLLLFKYIGSFEIHSPDFTKNHGHLFIFYLHSSPYQWLEVARNDGGIQFRLAYLLDPLFWRLIIKLPPTRKIKPSHCTSRVQQ